MIFWLKPKQARTANKSDSRPITEVTDEFSARSCDPPHPYMKNAPTAQKFCDQRRKRTFATLSARSGHFVGARRRRAFNDKLGTRVERWLDVRRTAMSILRGILGKVPSGPKSRVRNFIANKELGTQSDIHENVISPGVTLPWHFRETEEVIVVLEGDGECRTEEGAENYAAGDVIIIPPRVSQRTGVINQIRAFLLERGIAVR